MNQNTVGAHIWPGDTNVIADIARAHAMLEREAEAENRLCAPLFPIRWHVKQDRAIIGGYFKNGAWNLMDFGQFMHYFLTNRVSDFPKTFTPRDIFKNVYLVQSGVADYTFVPDFIGVIP